MRPLLSIVCLCFIFLFHLDKSYELQFGCCNEQRRLLNHRDNTKKKETTTIMKERRMIVWNGKQKQKAKPKSAVLSVSSAFYAVSRR